MYYYNGVLGLAWLVLLMDCEGKCIEDISQTEAMEGIFSAKIYTWTNFQGGQGCT